MNVHREMVRGCRVMGDGVLTAGIASALVRADDDGAHVVACWWIAYKFECVYLPDVRELYITYLQEWVGRRRMNELEADVLERIGWIVPRHNPIQRAFEDAGKLDMDGEEELRSWLYCIMYLRMDRWAGEEGGWWAVLRDALDGRACPVLCQVVLSGSPERYLSQRMKRYRSQPRVCGGKRARGSV